jgi:hypothetical protein
MGVLPENSLRVHPRPVIFLRRLLEADYENNFLKMQRAITRILPAAMLV